MDTQTPLANTDLTIIKRILIGIFIVLVGGARYSQVSYLEAQRGKNPAGK